MKSNRDTDALEYQYRKLERGIRMLMLDKRSGRSFLPSQVELLIKRIRSVYKELGRKPFSRRWPL